MRRSTGTRSRGVVGIFGTGFDLREIITWNMHGNAQVSMQNVPEGGTGMHPHTAPYIYTSVYMYVYIHIHTHFRCCARP